MKKAGLPLVLAVLAFLGCAESSSHKPGWGGDIRAGSPLYGWATACPACGADLGGGAATTARYLYEGTERARGPGREW